MTMAYGDNDRNDLVCREPPAPRPDSPRQPPRKGLLEDFQAWRREDSVKTDSRNLDALLSALGIVAPADLLARLDVPDRLDRLDQVLALAAGERLRLGELLRAAERITPGELDDVLAEQQRSGHKLGEILVERGHLSQRECDIVLEFQRRQTGAVRSASKLNLGSILVATGQITSAQLEGALRRQATTHRRLGDELVEAGFASRGQVERGLSLQGKLVIFALNVALCLASSPAVTEANAGETKASVQVSAVVVSWAPTVQVDYQAAQLTVTPEDVARGYVEAPAASQFRILGGGARSGWLIDFFARGQIFASVQIEGLGGSAQFGADGGTLFQRDRTPNGVTRLSYRFNLGANVQPGSYQWPLAMSVRAQ